MQSNVYDMNSEVSDIDGSVPVLAARSLFSRHSLNTVG